MNEARKPPLERCKHNMVKIACDVCSPHRAAKQPMRRNGSTYHGAAALSAETMTANGVAVVRTANGRHHLATDRLNEHTALVHIDGHPFVWALEEIVKHAPNVKIIQVIPSMFDKIHNSHREVCAARGVRIVPGHVRPDLAWEDGRIISPQYQAQRKFMLGLSGEQRALFDELLALGFERAQITARYFCLGGEDYVPQRVLAEQFGFATGQNAVVSRHIVATLYYLDDTIEAGEDSKRAATTMRVTVARLRPLVATAEARVRVEAELGVQLAPNFPLARLDVLRRLVMDKRSGRLAEVLKNRPNDLRAVALRFGLDEGARVYRTLHVVGDMMGGVTRERARQLEERALAALGIEEVA